MIRLTSAARDRIGIADYLALQRRADELGVTVGALWHARDDSWVITVKNGSTRTRLRAYGPLAAVLAGALDDYEAAA